MHSLFIRRTRPRSHAREEKLHTVSLHDDKTNVKDKTIARKFRITTRIKFNTLA